MAVYVDNAGILLRGTPRHHLTADSLAELHAFTQKVGIKRCWFHNRSGRHPHYDVTDAQRAAALHAGAHAVSSEMVAVKSRRMALGEVCHRASVVAPHERLGPITYWYPPIERQFQSPMHDVLNIVADDEDIVGRVVDRKKPIGVIYVPNWIGDIAIELAVKGGGYGVRYREDEPRLVCLTVGGVIRDTFDLNALLHDWEAWCAFIPDPVFRKDTWTHIQQEVERLAPMGFRDLADFGLIAPSYREGIPTGYAPETWVRCGLLFGYPLETTAAILLEEALVPGVGSDLGDIKHTR